jgi:hypothetical protein
VILHGIARRENQVIRPQIHGWWQRTLADWIAPTER